MSTQKSPPAGPKTRTTNTHQSPQVDQSSGETHQTSQGRRLTQRITLLLGERTSLSRVMLAVLSIAIILGLIGFAAHVFWIVTIIVMALGLGYLIANNRRDHTDAVNQRQEDGPNATRNG